MTIGKMFGLLIFLLLGLLLSIVFGCGSGGGGGTNGSTPPPVVEYGSAAGIVTDGRAAIAGVNVTVVGYPLLTAITDTTGNYSISNIPVGARTLRFSKTGYTATDQPVTIVANTVTTANLASFSASRPQLDSITPTHGAIGTLVTLNGLGFGSAQGTATFGGATSDSYTDWTNTQIKCFVPATATTGLVRVIASSIQSTENINFTIDAPPPLPPTINTIDPTSGTIGTAITITGYNFGATQGSSSVTIGGATSDSYTGWSNSEIVCTVPDGAVTGDVVITTSAGTSNPINFTINVVYHELVFSRVLANPGTSSTCGIAVANNNNILTYIVATGGNLSAFDELGNLKGRTTAGYNGLFGVGYSNNKVYITKQTEARILRLNFNSATQTVEEPAEINISWGSQLKHINVTNNSIYITSTGTSLIGKFDTNLQIPPSATWNPGFGPCGFCTNANETIGWAPNVDGTTIELDLLNGQTTQWTNSVGQYAWQSARRQNTLFFTSQVPQQLEWHKFDGTLLGSINTTGYNPTGICIYDNPSNEKTEAAVTFWEGRIQIYEIQEIAP